MKPARLAVAVAVLAAIIGGYYLYEEVYLAGVRAGEENAGLLFVLKAESVAKVSIKRPGSEDVEAILENGRWRIIKPFQTEADQKAVGRLARTAAELKETRDLGKAADPAEFGLDNPVVLEYYSGAGALLARLKIGARNPLMGGAFAQAEGKGHVSLIPGLAADDLDAAFFDLREKRFFSKPLEGVAAFEYYHAGMERARVERNKEGKWTIVSPIEAPASTPVVENLAEKFLSAQASGFYEEDVKDMSIYGLKDPLAEFTVFYDKDTPGVKMALGARTGSNGVFALWPDGKRVARIPDEILKDLPTSILDIRLKELVSFQIGDAEALAVKGAGGTMEVKKRASKKGEPELWDITRPVPMPADPVNVASLLRSLKQVEALGFVPAEQMDKARLALESPYLEIILTIKGVPQRIRFAKADKEDRYWAAAEGKKEALVVGKAAVTPLEKDSFFLRERRFFTMPSADVGRILIERLGETFELAKDGDDYRALQPDQMKITAKEWTEFVWVLFELRFAGVISEEKQKPGDPAFGKPAMAISVFGADGKLLERVEIAPAKDDDKWYRMRAANRPGLYDVDWFYVEDDVTLALEKALGRNKASEEQTGLFR